MATINISLPNQMYQDAKATLERRGYTSISEFIRDAIRDMVYPPVTENGFSPELEEDILKSEKDPKNWVAKWNGKGSLTQFVLKEGKRRAHDQRRV